jgi:hypothetical protein
VSEPPEWAELPDVTDVDKLATAEWAVGVVLKKDMMTPRLEGRGMSANAVGVAIPDDAEFDR